METDNIKQFYEELNALCWKFQCEIVPLSEHSVCIKECDGCGEGYMEYAYIDGDN